MSFISNQGVTSLVYALLHSLWQGGVVFLALSITLRCIPARRVQCRYLLTVGALCTILFSALFTCAWTNVSLSKTNARAEAAFDAPEPVGAVTPISRIKVAGMPSDSAVDAPQSHQFSSKSLGTSGNPDWMRWVAICWVAGVLVFLARTVTATFGAERLRKRAQQLVEPWALAMVEEIKRSLGLVRNVPLLVSDYVNLPAVVGLFSPAVLIPATLLTGLSKDELRAIIWHELAHIQRWDYLVNIGQIIVESLLFFNPFVWLVSRQIRQEREACCDAIASLHCEGPDAYVKAMLRCTELVKQNRDCDVLDLPAVAMGLGKGRNPTEGTFLDRAKRLLLSDYRPTIRLRGFTLVNLLGISGVTLALLLQGAYLAARVLSPKERIEKMAQLKSEYEPAPIPEDHPDIIVSGTLTGEGGEIIAKPQITLLSRRKGYSLNTTCRASDSDGSFRHQLKAGMVTIVVWSPGYAPLYIGPLRGDKDITALRLRLKKAVPADVLVVDPAGNPIPGVHISGNYAPEYTGEIDLKTGADGHGYIPSGSNVEADLKLEKSGYQETYLKTVRLEIDHPTKWVLSPAKPVHGTVTSALDGTPVPKAEIHFCSVSYGDYISPLSGQFPLLTSANEKGEFTLTNLRNSAVYYLEAEAPGFGSSIVRYEKSSGPLNISLGPKRTLRGRIVNANPLKGSVDLDCLQDVKVSDDGSYGTRKSLSIPIKNGTGDFEFTDLYATPTQICSGPFQRAIADFKASVTDIEIDMSAMAIAANGKLSLPKRKVNLHFQTPSGAPTMSGTLSVDCLEYGSGPGVQRYVKTICVPVHGNVATLDIPVPNELDIEPTGLIGYAFAKQSTLKVDSGAKPFDVFIEAKPAGAIFGELEEADGSPAKHVFIQVYNMKPMGDRDSMRLDVKTSSGGQEDVIKQFVASPLPLGGEYQVVVWRDSTFSVSDPVLLNEQFPFQKVKLRIPDGRTLRARIEDESGRLIEPLTLSVSYTGVIASSFTRDVRMNDEGILEVPHVNLDIPGSYRVRYDSRRKYQPFEFAFARGQTEATIRVQHGKTLDGIVIDAETGKPMADIEVYANVENFNEVARTNPPFYYYDAEAHTDESGRFHFSNLPEGRFQFNCRNAQRVDVSHDDIATAGQQEILTLKRRPTSTH